MLKCLILQTIDNSINTEFISLELTFLNMKPHKHLFFSRHIAMEREGMEKVVHYLDDHLPATFSYPLKTMEDCEMMSFLCRVLQVYLSFGTPVILSKSTFLTLQSH